MEQNDTNYLDSQINLKAENVENSNIIEIEPEKITDKKDEKNKEEKTSMEEKNDIIRNGEMLQTQIKIEPTSSNNKELKNLDQNVSFLKSFCFRVRLSNSKTGYFIMDKLRCVKYYKIKIYIFFH